jgi:hypothetical protein
VSSPASPPCTARISPLSAWSLATAPSPQVNVKLAREPLVQYIGDVCQSCPAANQTVPTEPAEKLALTLSISLKPGRTTPAPHSFPLLGSVRKSAPTARWSMCGVGRKGEILRAKGISSVGPTPQDPVVTSMWLLNPELGENSSKHPGMLLPQTKPWGTAQGSCCDAPD